MIRTRFPRASPSVIVTLRSLSVGVVKTWSPSKQIHASPRRAEAVAMAFLFSAEYHKVGKNGVSPFQNMCAYLGGSAIQTVGDNPVTAYRQLVQQYAKDLQGNTVAPKVAVSEANATFLKNPVGASLSGLWPRLIGVLLKRIPKFGFLLGYSFVVGEGDPGFAAATCASQCRRVGAYVGAYEAT